MKRKDRLTLKAKREGYKARSIYKFFAMNKKYNIVRPKNIVLDLGCWPGSWLQALSQLNCRVVGVDINMEAMDEFRKMGVTLIHGNVLEKETQKKIISSGPYDAVLSDMAPKTTGIKDVDQQRSLDLSLTALKIASLTLRPNGNFLCKIFQSPETHKVVDKAKARFHFVKFTKPQASKKRSYEIYLLCKGFRSK